MYTLFLSIRYLYRRFSALAALLAVTFGVATLFTVLSVMEGYMVKVREIVRGQESHLTLLGIPALSLTGSDDIQDLLKETSHVVGTAPFIESLAMYRSLNGFNFFQLKGVDPLAEARVGNLEEQLIRPEELDEILPQNESPRPQRTELEKRLWSVFQQDRKPLRAEEVDDLFSLERRKEVLKKFTPPGFSGERREIPGGLIVGINLLLDREIFLGDELLLIALSPQTGEPIRESFIVVGAFKSGEFETDSRTALVRIERLQAFLNVYDPIARDDRIEGLRIALDDYHHAGPVRDEILSKLAQASAGAKIPDFLNILKKIPAGFDKAKASLLAERLGRELEGGHLISRGKIEGAIQQAARSLAATPLMDLLARGVQRAYSSEVVKLGGERSWISEFHLISVMVQEVEYLWDQAFLGDPSPPSLLPSGEALNQAARRMVLISAQDDLRFQAEKLISRPFAAQVLTWEEQRPVLIRAVEREKSILLIIVILLMVFIGFIVLLMLMLLVIEKSRDIGVLLSLGAKPGGVVRIFLADGLAIVVLGVILGLIAGYFFTDNINRIHDAILVLTGVRLFAPEIYQLDRIPIAVTVSDVLLCVLPPVMLGFLASLIPAIWAARRDPIKILHYE